VFGASNSLASFTPLYVVLGSFGAILVALSIAGRHAQHPSPVGRFLLRVPQGMERITGMPGWAACAVGLSLLSLLTAGMGFYRDVAWHVNLGRDKSLFTAPHTMIIVGLLGIAASAGVGILYASLARVDTKLRYRSALGEVRVPWSMIPLGLLAVTALSGFPLDDMWHRQYGVDVTMWSPTHLLLIVGASLSPIAAWMALSEAGVTRETGVWAKIVRVLVALLVLLGLASVLGEFEFGVPQFQQLYHPVLISIASGFALVTARRVLGPGRALLIGSLASLMRLNDVRGLGHGGYVTPRAAAIFLAGAIAVELAALVVGTRRPLRFVCVSAAGIASIGLAGEWLWNAGAHQPWTGALLPEAVLLSAVAAAGAGTLAIAYSSALDGERSGLSRRAVVLGLIAVLAALAIPLPRRTGHVSAEVSLQPAGRGAIVTARLHPANAADGALWFQTISWQGGGLVIADMRRIAGGVYRSDMALPVTGKWKTLIRLHRGAEMMSVPVYMPADPEIGAAENPAVDRSEAFAAEQRYLLREQRPGAAWFQIVAYALLALIVVSWAAAFALATSRLPRRGPERGIIGRWGSEQPSSISTRR
jgi:hypothetical protein